MKLKGLTKLVLAGTALAATAATLTTSTYAWYVTNSKVEATSINGSVSGDSIDGSLFISANKVVAAVEESGTQGQEGYVAPVPEHDAPEKYGTAVGFSAVSFTALEPQSRAAANVTKNTYTLATVFESAKASNYYKLQEGSYVTAGTLTQQEFDQGTFYTQSTETLANAGDWVDKDGKAILAPKAQDSDPDVKQGKLITFKFWLRSSKAGTVSVKLVTDNKTTTAVQQQALAEGSFMPTGVSMGNSFVVDAVKALRIERIQQDGIIDSASANPTTTSKVYAVDAVSLNEDGTDYATGKTTAATRESGKITFATLGQNTDANVYYWNVLGQSGYNTNSSSGASEATSTVTGDKTAWSTITLSANVDTLLTFNVWLEGSDADCWDSCRGQLFDFNFEFALSAAPSSGN